MMKCKSIRKLFVDALYDELTSQQREGFDRHLESCAGCAREFAQLKQTMTAMDQRELAEPEEAFWEGYWNRLQPQLEETPGLPTRYRDRLRQLTEIRIFEPRVAMQLAVAIVLIALGIFIGRLIYAPDNVRRELPVYAEKSPDGQEAKFVDARTQRYLERSKVLLLGLVNFDSAEEDYHGLNFGHQQRISEELVSEAQFLKENVRGHGLTSLISDLEIILMQIANLESEQDINGIELIKSGIDRQGILLKINLEEIKQTSDSFDPDQQIRKSTRKNKIEL
ncbi:hypothetical protein GF337_18830 [candidate division KSB1 bacterium]|nr:hypothetical protein [candidate division KSB1 bacterium]